VLTATPQEADAAESIPVVRLPGTSGSAFAPPPRAVAAAVARSRPDVLHCHTSLVSPLAMTAARHGALAGIPTVVTVHSTWGAPIRAVYRSADRAVGWSTWPIVWTAVSTSCADTMRPLLAAGPEVVPNAIDVPYWTAAGRGARTGTGLHVAAVGRLAARKRSMDLLRVLRAARAGLPATIGLRATIVGDGPERGRMQAYLVGHGMSGWVRMVGGRPRDGVRNVVAGADAFLAPATLESFGIAALEARAAGVPVLARSGTGIADFVRHGREGLLGATRAELVDGLVRLAVDPGLRSSIALHNRRVAPWRYDWSAVLADVDRCYAHARSLHPGRVLSSAPGAIGSTTSPAWPDLRARSRRRG
jgi:phosphatidylinositol alpha 1,6-mannosyltransferase